ncbi:MAG: LysM peptidoglycan-binding domain-containing protein [Pseudomonadota bacterium]
MKKIPAILIFGIGLGVVASTDVFAQQGPKSSATTTATQTPAAKSPSNAKATDNPLLLTNDAPTMYTVVKGDTLWDISGKFLKEPWRWPEIWNMNRDQIKNPHLIYPGDVVKLSFDASGRPLLSIVGDEGAGGTIKLSPRIRSQALGQAIPSIPARVIGPFLSAPLVAEESTLNSAPRIIASEESRVIVGAGNIVYALGLKAEQGTRWQVYRPGKALTDPVTSEILGYEAQYLGDAKVTRFGEGYTTPSTIEITKSNQEINRGDRLMPAGDATLPQYSPRSPGKQVKGTVVSVVGGVTETAQYSIVVVNVGIREGIEIGHVLAAQRGGEIVATNTGENEGRRSFKSLFPASWQGDKDGIPPEVKLPEERNGLMVVFRVFDRVSYALVMSSKRPLKVGDIIQTP